MNKPSNSDVFWLFLLFVLIGVTIGIVRPYHPVNKIGLPTVEKNSMEIPERMELHESYPVAMSGWNIVTVTAPEGTVFSYSYNKNLGSVTITDEKPNLLRISLDRDISSIAEVLVVVESCPPSGCPVDVRFNYQAVP